MSVDLADAAVKMVLDHNLISMHLMTNTEITDKLQLCTYPEYDVEGDNSDEGLNFLISDRFIATRISRFRLLYLVYDRCSEETASRFLKREYEHKLLDS